MEAGQPKGKSAPLKLPDITIFMVGHDRCSSTHYYVAVTMVRIHNISDQDISFSYTESILTDIQSDCGCIKQELYFGHPRNAVFPLSHTTRQM